MGFGTLLKYFGFAMEAVEEVSKIMVEVAPAMDENSPGGKSITTEEKLELATKLDDNFSEIITRICQEVGLDIKSVTVEIEI